MERKKEMKTRLFQAACLFALVVYATHASAQPSMSVYHNTLVESHQKTPELSTNELRQILAEQSATVFDARPFMEYALSHIPGAMSVSAKPGVSHVSVRV